MWTRPWPIAWFSYRARGSEGAGVWVDGGAGLALIQYWLRGSLHNWAEALLREEHLREEGFFDPPHSE